MAQWHIATLISRQTAASDVQSLTFKVDDWIKHTCGQHYDIRLTAPDGYQAERKYSIASAPEQVAEVELGVQLLPGGEVSPYLFEMALGEQIEIRGPLGGHFLWNVSMPGSLILIGGGSGMVPLMSMVRHRQQYQDTRDVVFLISARSLERVLYYDELMSIATHDPKVEVYITLTDIQPDHWVGYSRRIDSAMLAETVGSLQNTMPLVYVCGPTPFVEAASQGLVAIGFHDHSIKTERFGGTGQQQKISG